MNIQDSPWAVPDVPAIPVVSLILAKIATFFPICSRWTVDFAEFVAECLVKNYEERPMASEVAEHPFLQNVSKNPTYIKRSLVRRIEDSANIRYFTDIFGQRPKTN